MNMQTRMILPIVIWGIFFFLSGHNPAKGDTLRIRSNAVKVTFPQKIVSDEVSQIGTSIQNDLFNITSEKKKTDFISDNVVIQVVGKKDKENLIITYSYWVNDTLKFQTDDFILGKYNVEASNAMLVTLEVMKKNVEGQLAAYIKTESEIHITINGSADATPVKGTIPYKGEFGPVITEDCLFLGEKQQMEISTRKGITNNLELAFLRSVAVKDYIEKNIFNKSAPVPNYFHSAYVSGERGGQYRRVSIEMIIYKAFIR